MSNQILSKIYIQQLNDYLLPYIDFKELYQSCNSTNNAYAKETLKRMHDIFVDIYGTDQLDNSYEFVLLPAVIRGDNTGRIAIGLIQLDLESSGEHWGTAFFTESGVVDSSDSKGAAAFIRNEFVPYSYWYTMQIQGDIHSQGSIPENVKEIIDACQSDAQQMTMR